MDVNNVDYANNGVLGDDGGDVRGCSHVVYHHHQVRGRIQISLRAPSVQDTNISTTQHTSQCLNNIALHYNNNQNK